MKKIVGVVSLMLFVAQGLALASAQPGTPEYEKLKEYKRAQREKKSVQEKAQASGAPAEKSFWQKEAERSGLAGTAAMFGNAVSGVVPLDKPNSRKNAK